MVRLRSLWIPAVLGAVAVGLWAAGTRVSKLSAYGYIGRSGDATLVVDMDAARFRGQEKYIPLLVWLGQNEPKTLHADRSSFSLKDPDGQVHALATPQEVTASYGPAQIANDYRYVRQQQQDYASMVFLDSRPLRNVAFFPNPAGRPGILYDRVELPNRTYFRTLLYFSNPAGKAKGDYTLIYDDPVSKTHIEVPFTIPWAK
jgi:hypothetical protein